MEVMAAGGATRVTMKNSWRRVGAADAAKLGKGRTAHLNWGRRGRCPRRRWDTRLTPPAGRQPTAEKREEKRTAVRPKAALICRRHLVVVFLLDRDANVAPAAVSLSLFVAESLMLCCAPTWTFIHCTNQLLLHQLLLFFGWQVWGGVMWVHSTQCSKQM